MREGNTEEARGEEVRLLTLQEACVKTGGKQNEGLQHIYIRGEYGGRERKPSFVFERKCQPIPRGW